VGCGRGEYLELLRAAGVDDVRGIEHSKDNVTHARERGFQVHQGYLAPGFLSPWKERFDAFAVFSFMEHWPDVPGSLRALRSVLKDGAVGLIEVPNFEFIVRSGLYSEFTVDHIFYFDQDTLRGILESNGFRVLSIDPVWHDYILSAQVCTRTPIDSQGFVARQTRIVRELQDYAGRFDRSEVAVWGAGHQALAVMSMAHLQDRVSHVLDSAPFKQDRFTPGTGLRIKAPETLTQDGVQAVIVMAAAYSDEIVRTIRSRYPHIVHLAVLREDGLEVIGGDH
jgi:SAM-dependent methyltransferase